MMINNTLSAVNELSLVILWKCINEYFLHFRISNSLHGSKFSVKLIIISKKEVWYSDQPIQTIEKQVTLREFDFSGMFLNGGEC